MTESLFPTLALYAETHFRFGGWTPSALFRREPEIVFDLPRRLAPGRDLPVALMVNDAHRYPIWIESVQIAVGTAPFEFDRETVCRSEIDHPLKNQQNAYILTIPRSKLGTEDGVEVRVNACLRYRRVKNGVPHGKIHTVLNDNLVTSTKFSYRCVISGDDYPGGDRCVYGDLHCHSVFSRSHVEWGPPLGVVDRVAGAGGLDFAAMTDHSYDLACDPGDFLRQDKDLRLWEMYKTAFDEYKGATVLIPGEEISVVNSKGKVVHLCGLGVSEYIPGTLDGARKNVYHKKQLTIEEAAREIERQGGVSFAAHAGAGAGFMQRIFLKRGVWSGGDLCDTLGGVQAVNSDFFESWKRGKDLWVSMLQKGRRIPILAGSDAHGDFNRYRAIGVPFLQIYEGAERYMGFVRTGVYGKKTEGVGGIKGIIDKIKDAATFVTNGPFVSICDDRRPEVSLIGSKNVTEKTNLCVQVAGTKEFGDVRVIRVMMGPQQGAGDGQQGEKIIINETFPPDTFEASIPIPADALLEKNCYLRVEAYGKSPHGFMTTAATSACFIGDG